MLLAVLMALSGCASQQGRVESSSEPPPLNTTPPETAKQVAAESPTQIASITPPTQTRPPIMSSSYPKTIQESKAGPAVLSLYKQAQDQRAANHPDQAVATLERAVHIEPRNPFIWQALAGANLDLEQADQAENAAHKSTSLARGNPYVIAGNWRIIAAAKQAQGDADGALQAQAQADQAAQAISAPP